LFCFGHFRTFSGIEKKTRFKPRSREDTKRLPVYGKLFVASWFKRVLYFRNKPETLGTLSPKLPNHFSKVGFFGNSREAARFGQRAHSARPRPPSLQGHGEACQIAKEQLRRRALARRQVQERLLRFYHIPTSNCAENPAISRIFANPWLGREMRM
jgi:hypothetical protein